MGTDLQKFKGQKTKQTKTNKQKICRFWEKFLDMGGVSDLKPHPVKK